MITYIQLQSGMYMNEQLTGNEVLIHLLFTGGSTTHILNTIKVFL